MSTNLSEICVYNAKLANKEFVGIFSEDGNLKVYFPLGYKEENNDIERRKSILNLIAVLGAFSDSLTANVTTGSSREIKKSFPIQAYLRIISDFYTRGYYYEV